MKPYEIGRFVYNGCRGSYLRSIARTWKVSIRTIAARMSVTQKRVREVFNLPRVPYFTACEYLEGITQNSRVFSPVIIEQNQRNNA